MYPDIEAVFVNTGLEFPEIQQFVKRFDNVTILTPEMRFTDVISKYGYPMISKSVANALYYTKKGGNLQTARAKQLIEGYGGRRDGKPSQFDKTKYRPILDMDFFCSDQCCKENKVKPLRKFEKATNKKPITAVMADESMQRQTAWLKTGCNAFDGKNPISKPMSHWTNQDILQYIKENNLEIASVYGEIVEENGKLKTTGCDRTGCIFCGFGSHIEKDPRFIRLKETHPKQYNYCINGGELIDGIWKPNKQGLGMGHVFDQLNAVYGEDFIKYK